MEIILSDFLMFYQIFLLPQVKRSAFVSNKQGVYELPHDLLSNLTINKNQKTLKTCKNYKLVPSFTAKTKTF